MDFIHSDYSKIRALQRMNKRLDEVEIKKSGKLFVCPNCKDPWGNYSVRLFIWARVLGFYAVDSKAERRHSN